MPTVHFMGYVEPRQIKLMIENLTPITEMSLDTGLKVSYTIAVLESVVSVECEMDTFNAEDISQLYTRSVELSRAIINMIAVKMGWGLFIHLDTFIHPDGTEEFLMNRCDSLAGIVEIFELDGLDTVFQMLGCDVDFTMALNDMNEAISKPRTAAVNCSRTIDAIRHLIAPGLESKAGWRVVQESLNVDESYMQYISNHSKNSRHGEHDYLPPEVAEELFRRTWNLINRYLYRRSHSLDRLPIDRFPQLNGAPTP